MSLFSKAIKFVAKKADDFFGTGDIIEGTVDTVGGFIEEGRTLAKATGLSDYISKAYDSSEPYQAPKYTRGGAAQRVSTTAGTYRSTPVSGAPGMGFRNPDVQAAWRKASQNPRIQASIQVVATTTPKRGRTIT